MTETTTVAELSGAMIQASKGRWQEGDVLTYVELVQKDYSKEEGGDGIPRCYCWVKSRKVKGNWHHSKQRLVVE